MYNVVTIFRGSMVAMSLITAGCGLTSEEIAKTSTQVLCKTVTSPANVDFSNQEILAELDRRKSGQCATQSIRDSNLADYIKAQEAERNQGGDSDGY